MSHITPLTEYPIYFLGVSGQQTLPIGFQRSVFGSTRALRVSISGEDPPQPGDCAPLLGFLLSLLNPELHKLLPQEKKQEEQRAFWFHYLF